MEEKTELKTFVVKYKCPSCETGYLKPTGQCFASYPPQYPHSCDNPNCAYTETFNETYPKLTYE